MQSARSRYRWPALAAAILGVALAAGAVTYWQSQKQTRDVASAMTGGYPSRAPELIRRYGCAGCHTISGIPGGDGQVGGPL
jgi:cytochrome c